MNLAHIVIFGSLVFSGTSFADEEYFCKDDTFYESQSDLCLSETEAVGPFPQKMIDLCIKYGGGEKTCTGDRWSRNFAVSLRGTQTCPKGSDVDDDGLCHDGEHAYGPFPVVLVEYCLEMGGGNGCKSMRWNYGFAKRLMDVGQDNEPESGKVLNVPYFAQRNNRFEPSNTCGVTSASMVINYMQNNQVIPDLLYTRYGKRQGQSPAGLASIYTYEGYKSRWGYNGTRSQIKEFIDQGMPVVIHGWLTGAGHIFVIVGYNDQGFIVNDPAGLWLGCYKCGYAGGSGKEVLYTYEKLSNAVIGRDGDIWFSTITN